MCDVLSAVFEVTWPERRGWARWLWAVAPVVVVAAGAVAAYLTLA
ncbi:hypothetical protein [Patulibacter sp. SYSU D01012]|nr:hypothetical protein [Patulibacter sp. SYSU D01012]